MGDRVTEGQRKARVHQTDGGSVHQADGGSVHQTDGGSVHQADGGSVHQADGGSVHQTDGGSVHQADGGSVHQADGGSVHQNDGGESPIGIERPTEAVLLCGGRGSRLGGTVEKPLVEIGNRPMVSRVIDAIAASGIHRVVAISSPHTPETTRYLRGSRSEVDDLALDVLVGTGEGYIRDLDRGLGAVDGVAVTVASDLPLLRASDIDAAVTAWAERGASTPHGTPASVTVCVTPACKRTLGVSTGTTISRHGRELCPTGVNVVSSEDDDVLVRDRESVAVNVNTRRDLQVARRRFEEP